MSVAAERRVDMTKAELADAIASRLVEVIADAVASRGVAHVVLTGGSMGEATGSALALRASDVDWAAVHLWWGDERFLPAGDAERNETQARTAFIDAVGVPAGNVHAMGAAGASDGDDVAAAAQRYAVELAAFGLGGTRGELFDVVMLGMGPDTHVASLFPGYPQTSVDGRPTTSVSDSPKPPPQRVTMTFDALNASRQVWLMIAGADKADAVRAAAASDDRTAHPASGVHGLESTIWWLDSAAAGDSQ